MGDWKGRLARLMPTRETIARSRLLRPFAAHLARPDLWHLNHRSVPRGVALGLGIGILVPFMHIILVAIIAIPIRANILLAAAFTLLINPLTMPPLYYSAYRLGLWELQRPPLPSDPAAGELAHLSVWLYQATAPIALGLATLALLAALLGYAGGAIGWRLLTAARARALRQSKI